jgi:hypothetical protein
MTAIYSRDRAPAMFHFETGKYAVQKSDWPCHENCCSMKQCSLEFWKYTDKT